MPDTLRAELERLCAAAEDYIGIGFDQANESAELVGAIQSTRRALAILEQSDKAGVALRTAVRVAVKAAEFGVDCLEDDNLRQRMSLIASRLNTAIRDEADAIYDAVAAAHEQEDGVTNAGR